MTAQEPPERTDWPGVLFAVGLGVLAAYQQFKLPPALPLMSATYGYDRLLSGGLMSAYAVAGLLLSIGIGNALDGARGRLVIGAAFPLFAAGNLLCLAMPESGLGMLGGRTLEGAGLAVISVAGPALAARAAAPADKPLAIALWATWMPIGHTLANLAAVPVLAASSWAPLWWLALAMTAGMAAWAVLRLRGDAPRSPPPSPSGIPETRAPSAAVIAAAAIFMLWTVQYLAFTTWLPSFLVEARGMSPAAAALALTVAPVVLIPFNLAAGALLARRWRLHRLLAASLVVQGAVWAVGPWATGVAGLALLAAWGAAAGVTATCLFSLPVVLSGGASRSFGVLMTGRNIGVLVGPLLLAQVLAASGSWELSAQPFTLAAAAAAAGALLLGRRLRPPR